VEIIPIEVCMSRKVQHEMTIFEYFIKKQPDFAGRKITWGPGTDPPDVRCSDEDSKRIGVELGNETQMATCKKRESIEESFRSAVRSRETPHPSNIGMVHFGLKDAVKPSSTDSQGFHDEMYALVEVLNQTWPPEDLKYSPRGYVHHDFSGHPTLGKYLHMLEIVPSTVINPPDQYPWIDFRPWGTAYSSQTTIDALAELVAKKTAKYDGLNAKENLTELYLVAYYDQGLFYNTPTTPTIRVGPALRRLPRSVSNG
jgi:hypothetical protein